MFTGLQGQKIMYTTSFVRKIGRKKNPGFDKGKTAGMFGLTLYDLVSFISLYIQGIKVPFENKVRGLAHRRSLVSPCFSFSLPLSFSLSSILLSATFFPYLSLNHFPRRCHFSFGFPWILRGLDSGIKRLSSSSSRVMEVLILHFCLRF